MNKEELKDQKEMVRGFFILILVLTGVIVTLMIKVDNVVVENEILKSQIETYTIKIHCEGLFDIEEVTAEYKLDIVDSVEDYELFIAAIEEIKDSPEFEDCEVMND